MKKGLVVLSAMSVLAMSLTAAATAAPAKVIASAPQASAKALHGLGYKPTPLAMKVNRPAPNMMVPHTNPTSFVISSGLPAVGDQGQQGSCVAWSLGYYQKSYGHGGMNPTGPSNEYSPSFIYNSLDGGVDGGLVPGNAYNFLVSSGDTTLADMPYNQYDYTTQPTSTQKSNAALHKNVSSTQLFSGAGRGSSTVRTTVKNYLYNSGSTKHTLVGIAIPVYPEWDNAQANDTYVVDRPKSGEASRGGHMVTIIGYDDNKVYNGYTGAFKVINQWGTSWGNAGYTWISYDFFQNYVSEAWVMETGTN